ncbi:unnamed protein product [Nippostrongylus brasiliensis]|uniref:AIRS_C domain-containing protein n=1 Tax=Nippostrongylus brasiliensis TaxID=27835 RepID=A0A0N4XQE9_NIPBR|nr:unnamed protein product [Nippostrongylus brasiliensis]
MFVSILNLSTRGKIRKTVKITGTEDLNVQLSCERYEIDIASSDSIISNGIGMVLVIAPTDVENVVERLKTSGEQPVRMGRVIAKQGGELI